VNAAVRKETVLGVFSLDENVILTPVHIRFIGLDVRRTYFEGERITTIPDFNNIARLEVIQRLAGISVYHQ